MPAVATSRIPYLPSRIEGLAELAMNLWWSWNRDARALFASIDPLLWHQGRHDPFHLLRAVEPARLAACASDSKFLQAYDSVMARFQAETQGQDCWFTRQHGAAPRRPVAYFCAEFGLHASVPIYSGGLGVLAGDHCKSAADLGVPLVGVGLLYLKGYFDQRLTVDGWQEDSDVTFDLESSPLVPLEGKDGVPYLAVVEMGDRTVHVRAWRMMVGRVPIYLLDTNLELNHADDRALLNKLYATGGTLRLRQEWILGVGGVRVLRALGIDPAVWHANEGHAAFMGLERIRERLAAGEPVEDAIRAVRTASVFTTHTPVPAGHDHFAMDDVRAISQRLWQPLGVDPDLLLALGRHPDYPGQFHMTALAVRTSSKINGVSRRHGIVSRELLGVLWPKRPADSVPVRHVTNGVHLPTWMAGPIKDLLTDSLGATWPARADDPALWDAVLGLNLESLWRVHRELKQILVMRVREEARRRFATQLKQAVQVVGSGVLLDPDVFTIGFARRFATYKRADLVFRDYERLRRLCTDARRPVQIIFAGKAHPADTPGKEVLQRVYRFTRDPAFEGRVAFLEDYDMHVAHLLVQGVDLWVNLPRAPLEASGTSGMKAGMNGVPQLSTLDGWWEEAYDGISGWAIAPNGDEAQDASDAEQLYQLLEDQVVPLYYTRDARGVPLGWVERMRHAMRLAGRQFSANRMLRDYVQEYYVPAMDGAVADTDPPTG